MQASAAQAMEEAAAAEGRIAAQIAAAAAAHRATLQAAEAASAAGAAGVADGGNGGGAAHSLQAQLRCAEEAAERRAAEVAELRALVESHQQQLWCA